MMKEFNSVLEMLIENRTQLLEAKVRIKEREAEIDKDLRDCQIAIAALTPKVEVAAEQPQEPTERLPKVGDELIAICETDEFLTKGKTYSVIHCWDSNRDPMFEIKDDMDNIHGFSYDALLEHFRFADEPTSEDLANLHSYLHVNGEAKKPYRIKFWDELLATEGAELRGSYFKHLDIDIYEHVFNGHMAHLCGKHLDQNTEQVVDTYQIEPWMITENK